MTLRVLFTIAMFVAACTWRERLCEHWALEQRETMPESGAPQMALVRTSARPPMRVDTHVFQPSCFSEDCVIYGTHRGGDERIFVVCGDRRPIQLNVARGELDAWHFGTDGFETDGEPVLTHGKLYQQRRLFKRSALFTVAIAQPVIESDWAKGSVRTLDPESDLLPIDPKSAIARKMLTAAIARSDGAIASDLIKAGTDIETTDDDGQKPIVLAAQAGLHEVVRNLLDAGADSSSRDVRGDDVLMIAVNRHDVVLVKILFDRRGALQVDPRAALRVASSLGQDDTVPMLEAWARESH
ncbi:MAG TPA: ankyrin repeat domain-containing protein [Thermoanaerobaculia bacterium]|nr:ankyrin repeat domain-containing protein [Thermoanaerobaculia bacterium]